MKLPKREDCIHYAVCKYDDDMCPTECGHFSERSDNSDYAKCIDELCELIHSCNSELTRKVIENVIKKHFA